MADAEDRPLPAHVTTPLLTLITARSMDEDYAHVAKQREAAGGSPRQSGGLHWASLVVVGILGLLATVVTVQTDREAGADQQSRSKLIEQIESRRDRVGEFQAQVAELTDENQAAVTRAAQVQRQLATFRANVRSLEVTTGFAAVHGEGVKITVANQPGADGSQEIRDTDLATLVDGLWSAGAEAIAINEQRINLLGGIRNTGRAIHVNGRPVNPPYVIKVIGDNQSLLARLLETSQGSEWSTLVRGLGFRYTPQNVDDIELPAAPSPDLRDVVELTIGPNGALRGEEKP